MIGPRVPTGPRDHVVCVEPDLGNFAVIKRVLESALPVEVLHATDVVSALDLARRELPVLVLTELALPVGNGFEVARRIAELGSPDHRRIPFVAVTASVMHDERKRCFAAGFGGFVEKPFDIQELRRVVATLLDVRAAKQ